MGRLPRGTPNVVGGMARTLKQMQSEHAARAPERAASTARLKAYEASPRAQHLQAQMREGVAAHALEKSASHHDNTMPKAATAHDLGAKASSQFEGARAHFIGGRATHEEATPRGVRYTRVNNTAERQAPARDPASQSKATIGQGGRSAAAQKAWITRRGKGPAK
jgi:hypothetical protein